MVPCPRRCSTWGHMRLSQTRSGEIGWSKSQRSGRVAQSRGSGTNGGVSAPGAGEPRSALDPGMRVALRCDRRWLRRRSGHLGRRHADAHNNPVRATLAGHPARPRIRSSHPLELSHGLVTIHESQDSALTRARPVENPVSHPRARRGAVRDTRHLEPSAVPSRSRPISARTSSVIGPHMSVTRTFTRSLKYQRRRSWPPVHGVRNSPRRRGGDGLRPSKTDLRSGPSKTPDEFAAGHGVVAGWGRTGEYGVDRQRTEEL